jgi:O-antigen/teichoic acid export membrane protein
MRIERTKNATKNIIFGVILKLYQILVPFFIRTAMIYSLGIEYLGLNSLFTSILQVLNLAELGVGSAMVFSMYKPISEDDDKKICALMQLYKIYYRFIGIVVLVVGLILCPFVPYLIKNDLPKDMNIYILYILNLLATVFSYWLFAYKNSILQAHQRQDIISKVTILVNTIQYILQIIAICVIKNYYLYVVFLLLAQIFINVITAYKSNIMYPQYKAYGKLEKEEIKKINRRVRDLFTAKIGGIIVNSADSIVISSFLGLKVLAIYQNYYYILTAIIGIVGVIFSACTAGIGNSLIVESKEKNYNDLKKFTFIIVWIAGFCASSLMCMFQTFMELWVGRELLLDIPIVVCLVIYYFIYEINALLNLYKDAAGIWHSDRFRPLITAGTNLILNLILVNYIGLYGVILSTVISSAIIGMPWLLHNLSKEVFRLNLKEYIIELLKYIMSVACIVGICYYISSFIHQVSVIALIVKGIICIVVFNLIFIILNFRKKEFYETMRLVKKIFNIKNRGV